MRNSIRLPKRNNIYVAGPTDPVNFYYTFPFRGFYTKRLKLVYSMLSDTCYDKILELGYGSGLSLLELAEHAREVHGIDLHTNTDKAYEMLEKEKSKAVLASGSIDKLPYADNNFDCIAPISIFEHIKNIEGCAKEACRLLKP